STSSLNSRPDPSLRGAQTVAPEPRPRGYEPQPTRWASTSISRSTFLPTKNPPVSTAIFQVMSQSSLSIVVLADAANIGFPSMSGPHPRNFPERVIGLVMSLIVRSPSSSNEESPV